MTNYKKIIVLLIVSFIIASFILSNFTFAAETSAQSKELFEGLKKAFIWIIGVAAGLAAVVFAYGTIEFMFGRPEGKDKMFGSIVGLFLSLTSLLIMYKINPALISPLNITPLPETGNVFLVKANGDRTPANFTFRKKPVMDQGYIGLVYDCGKLNPKKTPRLLASTYTDFLNLPNHSQTKQIECSNQVIEFQPVSADVWEVSLQFEFPGVYFYTDSDCKGMAISKKNIGPEYMGPQKSHISNFPDSFVNKVKCMIFVTGDGANKDFAVFPTNTPKIVNGDGTFKPGNPCGVYYSDVRGDRTPIKLDYCQNSVKSALIFYIPDDPKTAGNEVSFYSEPDGWTDQQKQKAGEFKITFEDIDQRNGINLDPSKMIFKYLNPDPTNPYQRKCRTFKDCPKSIRIVGDYLVSLQSRSQDKRLFWSTDATEDVNSLSIKESLPAAYPDFYDVFILPIVK